jgi:AcrR family transcriptional regulator
MGIQERRQRDKENLRRRILDAARELFCTEGYEAVTLRKIANAIEYSPTTIYLHFADKDAILVELAEEGFGILTGYLKRARHLADPIERLREGGKLYFQFAVEQSHYYTIMFELRANALAKGHEPTETAAHQAFGFILTCVSEAMRTGQIPVERVEEIATAARGGAAEMVCRHAPEAVLSHVVWSAMHGAASLLLSGRLGMLPEEAHPYLLTMVVENILRGLTAGGDQGSASPGPESAGLR